MSLARRIARLEALAPPPPAAPVPWWEQAPAALLAYLATLPAAVWDDPALRPLPVVGLPGHTHHWPVVDPRCPGVAVLDALLVHGAGRLGPAQRAVLYYAWRRAVALLRERGLPQGEAYRRAWGVLHGGEREDVPYGLLMDGTGATWPRLWREAHTADAATLAALGLGEAELALLAAEEGGAGAG